MGAQTAFGNRGQAGSRRVTRRRSRASGRIRLERSWGPLIEPRLASVSAEAGRSFLVVKRQFGFAATR